MPDWLVQVIIQYPIVVIVGFVAWFAHREVRRSYTNTQTHERQVHADAIENARRTHERMVELQEAEIARLSKELKDEVRKLTKAVAELNARLNS